MRSTYVYWICGLPFTSNSFKLLTHHKIIELKPTAEIIVRQKLINYQTCSPAMFNENPVSEAVGRVPFP
jgi:hypothetical protein